MHFRSTILHHLYIVLCVHHPKSSLLLLPFSTSPHSLLTVTVLLSVSALLSESFFLSFLFNSNSLDFFPLAASPLRHLSSFLSLLGA